MIDNRDFLKVPSEVLHVRRVGAEVLRGIGAACFAASAVSAVLLMLVWFREDDFPGRYLVAVVPLVAAALSLYAAAFRVERGL